FLLKLNTSRKNCKKDLVEERSLALVKGNEQIIISLKKQSTALVVMVASNKHSLLHYEDLTLPSVIVMTANMGCAQCRKKVSQVLSKMTGRNFDGLREYTVDVSNKQVIVKADFGFRWNVKDHLSKSEKRKDWRSLQLFKSCFGPICYSSKQVVAD
ncbi:hypothetical protein QUC31_008725, partial [Theobroma cacao]